MKRAVFLSLLIILYLVAACGCAGGSVERGALLLETDHAAASNGGGRAEESRSMRTEVGEAMIGGERAREIALKHAGVEEAAATRMKVETDREKGRQIYGVEFTAGAKKYEYKIDAHTGEVISFEQKAVQKAVQKAAVKGGADTKKYAGGGAAVEKGTAGQGSALIGKDAALKVALKHAGVSDSKVLWQEVELDYEKGRQIYEVEFSAGEKKYEYDIDACTGKVISHEYKVKQAAPTEKVESLIEQDGVGLPGDTSGHIFGIDRLEDSISHIDRLDPMYALVGSRRPQDRGLVSLRNMGRPFCQILQAAVHKIDDRFGLFRHTTNIGQQPQRFLVILAEERPHWYSNNRDPCLCLDLISQLCGVGAEDHIGIHFDDLFGIIIGGAHGVSADDGHLRP
jgi:uncharacterized membrane protein YkoI